MNEKPVEEVPSGDVKAELKNQEQQLRLVYLKGKNTPFSITHFYSSKYGNIDKRKGNPMLMKKLAGKKQYFDSGDYNMQNAKPKGPHKGPMVPNPMANPMTKPSE